MKTKEEQNDAIMLHRLGRGMLCLIQALITKQAEQGEYLELKKRQKNSKQYNVIINI